MLVAVPAYLAGSALSSAAVARFSSALPNLSRITRFELLLKWDTIFQVGRLHLTY